MKTRSEIAEPINLILDLIKNLLVTHKEAPVVLSAFRALKAIATTLCNGEEGSMAELVPHVFSASKEKYSTSEALGALAVMSYVWFIFFFARRTYGLSVYSTKIGPRIIPFFRPIISHSITILRGEDNCKSLYSLKLLAVIAQPFNL